MRFDQAQRPKSLTGKAPTRRITKSDGTVVVEKLNPMRLKRKAVDPAGWIVEVSLANGWQHITPRSEYAVTTWEGKTKKGWLPYNECPLANGMVPTAKGEKACTGKFTDEACCPHMEKIIRAREAVHRKKQDEFAAQMDTRQDRMVKLLEAQATAALNAAEANTDGKKLF
jgi:hypothetical protein